MAHAKLDNVVPAPLADGNGFAILNITVGNLRCSIGFHVGIIGHFVWPGCWVDLSVDRE